MSSEPTLGTGDELGYHPVLDDAPRLLRSLAPARALLIGELVCDGVEAAGEIRRIADPPVYLPSGTYRFEDEDGWVVMVVSEGSIPGAPTTASWAADDEDPLIAAFGWFDSWWADASPVDRPHFSTNEPVVVASDGREGHVRGREFDHGEWWYQVRLDGRTQDFREAALAPPLLDDDPHAWISRVPEPAVRLAATITGAKLRADLTDTVYSFRASRTVFRPYQFRPVLRLLESQTLRLLVADEVGLGKTIEAGLIWTELDARRQADRVLVVCPSMLVQKWRAEMEQRFGYELTALARADLDDMLMRIEEDRLPSRFHAIASVEGLRMWNGLDRLAELAPRFDLVIVDEAHVFRNSGTRSHALGALLSDWADALVFLSATPLNLGNDDLFNLLELLVPGDFDDRQVLEQRLAPNAVLHRVSASLVDPAVTNTDRLGWLSDLHHLTFGSAVVSRPEFAQLTGLLEQSDLNAADVVSARRLIARLHALSAVVTRTRKIEIEDRKAVREAIPVDVRWTTEEAMLYQRIDAWQRKRARRKGLPIGFATQMPLRLASTCLPAARDKVLDLAAGRTEVDEIEGDDEAGPDDDPWAALLDELDVPPAEVVAAATALGDVDTKFDEFVEVLDNVVATGRRVLVFSFSRPTLSYLTRRLGERFRVGVMHGGIHKDDRPAIMRRFRAGEFDVLLASRVASEGLDFEFCSAVVNYDLPWNPMEVEQRIGRIDRFGQTEEKILVVNFHTPGTIETEIVARVHSRIGVFTQSIGELEPILRSKVGELRRTMFDFELTADERERRIVEMLAAVEEQRHALDEVEQASAFLASADAAEIDGLERDLTASGRYIGQPELVVLLQSWAGRSDGTSCSVSQDGKWLRLRGTAALDDDLKAVQAKGERSASELASLSRALRDEIEVHLCLDQELAREQGAPLLTANHPFVRAALLAGGSGIARFAKVSLEVDRAEEGTFLVLLSLARWRGVRPATELWTTGIDLATRTRTQAADAAAAALLAQLAEAKWQDGAADADRLAPALRVALSQVRRRQSDEEASRSMENAALLEVRRLSIRETFRRKEELIRRRIATARSRGSDVAVRLQESQLRAQDHMLRQQEAELDVAATGTMEVEHLAVCLVEVAP